ncbi:ammonia channel protein, partial [Acinetobacter baumannii]
VRDGTDIPESAFVLFGLAGAVVAAGLLSGAWAERGTLGWALPFTGLWSLIVYAPLTHWVRGGGWLASRLGTVDFAGGLVLHGSLGVSAL